MSDVTEKLKHSESFNKNILKILFMYFRRIQFCHFLNCTWPHFCTVIRNDFVFLVPHAPGFTLPTVCTALRTSTLRGGDGLFPYSVEFLLIQVFSAIATALILASTTELGSWEGSICMFWNHFKDVGKKTCEALSFLQCWKKVRS